MTETAEIIAMICRRIKMTRIEKNLSQVELAELSKLGIATIKRVEQGESISLSTLIAVLRGLGELDQLNNLLAYSEIKGLNRDAPKRKRKIQQIAAIQKEQEKIENDFIVSQQKTMTWKYK